MCELNILSDRTTNNETQRRRRRANTRWPRGRGRSGVCDVVNRKQMIPEKNNSKRNT